ncbi:MAG TPA: rhomboid family intramembrane serine protease, partial [Ornithinibacter sp.]|nr:rhomboid family intramembrane serine protease [Ornithinibacter sp.]
IGINAVLGFVIPGIAWQAHLGGFLTGAAAAATIAYTGRRRSPLEPPNRTVHWAGLVGILAVLLVLAAAKYAVSL